MKHPMRTVAALSAALMAAGAALAMFGAAGGGSAQGSLVRGLLDTLHIGGNHSAYVLASAEAEPGKTYGLCVEAGAGEFTVAVGDEFRVDASRPDAVEAQSSRLSSVLKMASAAATWMARSDPHSCW